MRFHTPSSPPPYFNRRDQRRLLGMVAILALILVAARLASRETAWHWLLPPDGNSSRLPASSQSSETVGPDAADNDQLQPDEFRVAASESAPPQDAAAANPESETTVGPRYVIRPQLLADVRDSRLGLRRSEADAYFAVLATIRDLPAELTERVALRGVTYTALMASPGHYRGQLVHLQCQIKRVTAFTASQNTHGIEDLYDVWFLTNQSGDKPLHARCTQMPDKLVAAVRRGESVQVELTGYFFRIEAYSAVGGIRTTPLILCHSPVWMQSPTETRSEKGLVPYVIAFVIIVSLASGLTLWMYQRSDRAFADSHLKRLAAPQAPAIDTLQELDTNDPSDMFRNWSQSDTDADADPD